MRYLTLAMTFISLWLINLPVQAAQDSVLTGNVYQTVNVRSGPDTQYEIVAKLDAGQTVTVNGRESEATRWLRVVLEAEEAGSGWVTAFSVTLEGDPAALPVVNAGAGETPGTGDPGTNPEGVVVVIAYGRVNVRSGPGIEYDAVGQLELDEEATVLARSNTNSDWLYIEHNGLMGWVAYFTVAMLGDPTVLPVRVPDANHTELVPPSALIATRYNVRLRSAPSTRAPVVGLVPFNSDTTPIAQTRDGRWLYVLYVDGAGWGLTQLFDLDEAQQAHIPVFIPDEGSPVPPTLTPQSLVTTATPETSATRSPD